MINYTVYYLLAVGLDIEINTYTYAEVKFYSENYAETILRHPSLKTDRERLKFIHELFLFYKDITDNEHSELGTT